VDQTSRHDDVSYNLEDIAVGRHILFLQLRFSAEKNRGGRGEQGRRGIEIFS
jgi:hypothetical protein